MVDYKKYIWFESEPQCGKVMYGCILCVVKKFFYWLPRILAILYICFFSVFALDVFGEPQWPLALFMHLIPSMVLLTMTIVAWKKERVGGILFFLAGVFILVFYHTLWMALPAFAISFLLLIKKK